MASIGADGWASRCSAALLSLRGAGARQVLASPRASLHWGKLSVWPLARGRSVLKDLCGLQSSSTGCCPCAAPDAQRTPPLHEHTAGGQAPCAEGAAQVHAGRPPRAGSDRVCAAPGRAAGEPLRSGLQRRQGGAGRQARRAATSRQTSRAEPCAAAQGFEGAGGRSPDGGMPLSGFSACQLQQASSQPTQQRVVNRALRLTRAGARR